MKIKTRLGNEQLVVYREKAGVLLFTIAMTGFCIAFGVTFMFVGQAHVFMQIFGGFFTVAGVLLFAGLPKYYRKMQREGGAILLSASRDGLTLAPVLNMTPTSYPWSDIERIVLTKKLTTKDAGERGSASNQAIVYFRRGGQQDNIRLLQRSRSQIWKSPQGHNVCVVDMPKESIDQIKEGLSRFAAKGCEVHAYSKIILDYVDNAEHVTP